MQNNPDLAGHTKIMLKPPQVIPDGGKRTIIKNFASLCAQI